jgi:hypothetical protein
MPSLTEFKSSFKNDIARPSRFDVEIPVPLKLVAHRNTGRQLSFRCENAELPSRTLATTERKTYGPTELHPYLTTYNQSTFTFIVSDDMKEKKFFDAWMDLINSRSTYNLAFKNDYAVSINVNQYNLKNEMTYSVSLVDAFPISVNQLDLDWSNESTYHKLSVVFAYYIWESNNIQAIASEFLDAGVSTAVDAGMNFLKSRFSDTKTENGGVFSMKSIAKVFDNL